MLLSMLAVSVYSDSVKHDSVAAASKDAKKAPVSKPLGHHDLVKEAASLVEKVAPKVNKPSQIFLCFFLFFLSYWPLFSSRFWSI